MYSLGLRPRLVYSGPLALGFYAANQGLRTLVTVWLVDANTGAPGPCLQAADGAKRVIALRLVAETTQGEASGRRGLRAVAGRRYFD